MRGFVFFALLAFICALGLATAQTTSLRGAAIVQEVGGGNECLVHAVAAVQQA
jgi:hypothetical protein